MVRAPVVSYHPRLSTEEHESVTHRGGTLDLDLAVAA
jgi:hypothetical protein